jgi:hypothetical protein
MPAITDPHRYREPIGASARSHSRHDPAHSLRTRIHAATHRGALTRRLAQGADPGGEPELALRAEQLTSRHNRRVAARTLRRIIDEAHKPNMVGHHLTLIRRGAVIEAEDMLTALSARLLAPAPVRAQGMARLERLLSNADQSPLYNRSRTGALQASLATVIETLDAPAAESHEFPIPA